MKEFIVYAKWIAYELRKRGFRIIKTTVNPTRPEYDCWIFEESPEMIAAFKEIVKKQEAI